jgi:hypothetical protein
MRHHSQVGIQLSGEKKIGLTHGITDLDAEPLELASGVIWTALNIDYPGHSFSHLGLFFGKSTILGKHKASANRSSIQRG